MNNLYIVSTPIGNLQDVTKRAIDVLGSVDYIICEDTRTTGSMLKKVLTNFDNKGKLISYYEQNELKRIPEILSLLIQGKSVALVSDAGTPTISDPGFKLVREALKSGIKVVSVPGPSSVTSALTISGLPTDKFLFLGFLPKKSGNRLKILNSLNDSLKLLNTTVIIFESPHSLITTLNDLKSVFGDINVTLCREITKIYEETKKGNIKELIDYYSQNNPKGEFVLLFNLKDY